MVRSEAFRAVDAVSRLLHRQVVASGADLGRGRGSFLEAVVQSLFPYQPRELLDHLARAGVLDDLGLFHASMPQGEVEARFFEAVGLAHMVPCRDPEVLLLAWSLHRGRLAKTPRELEDLDRDAAMAFAARFPGHGLV